MIAFIGGCLIGGVVGMIFIHHRDPIYWLAVISATAIWGVLVVKLHL